MERAVYVSTGAFIGRANGRNPHLALDAAQTLRCDGFEWMIFEDAYPRLEETLAEYRAAGLRVPVVHVDKRIGNLISAGDAESAREAARLMDANLSAAARVGAKKAVMHGWGIPDSDLRRERVYEQISSLWERARTFGIDLLVENCCCVHDSPLNHLTELARREPRMGFTVDTRCAQFHREVSETLESPVFAQNVRHLHVSDIRGEARDWKSLYPILHPGQGQIDWETVKNGINRARYEGSITLESPATLTDGIDDRTLNASLDWIREHLAAVPSGVAD